MRALVVAGGLLGLARGAAAAPGAGPIADVNLIAHAPTIVAVSSTVANDAIRPGHLVDGDLTTAWNSRTGDLVGAWIGARVPPAAHVTAIRMTVGFTKVDKQLGDLFTQNPRIRKVRVTRDGARVAEVGLDPDKRTLQEIPVDGPGGEYRIEILEIVPGTKKTWREVAVSELEIWGSVATATATATAPVVRVGSFAEPPPITAAECVQALFPSARGTRVAADPDAEQITNTEVVGLSPALALCRVDHAGPAVTEDPMAGTPVAGRVVTRTTTTVELAPVTRAPRLVAGKRLIATIKTETSADEPSGNDGSVTLTRFPLTATEDAVRVDVTDRAFGPMSDSGSTQTTLYRVAASGLTSLLAFKSIWDMGEASDEDRCDVRPPATVTATPQPLEIACVHVEGRWHGEDPRGNGEHTKTRTIRYRWAGSRYRR